jgi:GT2 family glycosyltransferase
MNSIAILIVTWNSTPTIDRVLDSITKQTRRPDRVLIIDNNSDDLADLKDILNKYNFCDLLALPSNTGFAAANNVGIETLKACDYIVLLNPDAFPLKDWLFQLVNAITLHPAYGSFASLQLQQDENYIDGSGDCLTISGQPFRRHYSKKSNAYKYHAEPIFSACAAAAAYKTKALQEVGGFDEDFFCYVEDVDLGFRLQMAGYPCLFVPDAKVVHLGSSSTGKRSNFSIYYGQRNMVYNFFKNMPTPLLFIFIIPHIFSLFLFILFGFVLGKGEVMLKAKLDAYSTLHQSYRKRKKIQSKKKVSSFYILKLLSLIKY